MPLFFLLRYAAFAILLIFRRDGIHHRLDAFADIFASAMLMLLLTLRQIDICCFFAC